MMLYKENGDEAGELKMSYGMLSRLDKDQGNKDLRDPEYENNMILEKQKMEMLEAQKESATKTR